MKVIIIILLFISVGCNNNGIKSGIIINKSSIPEHFETTYILVGQTMMPITTFHPAIYTICIKDNIGQYISTNNITVDKALYESKSIGEQISFK